MNRFVKSLIIVLVAAVMLVDLYLDSRAGPEQAAQPQVELDLPVGTQSGELAPALVGTTLDGETISLADLRGQIVLINVFASWCGPCRAEAPHLADVSRNSPEDVVFLGLNLQEDPAAVAGFRDDFGLDFPLIVNQDGALTEIYQPIGLPTSWFIDRQGVVRYVHAGPMTAQFLEGILDDIRAGRQPDPFASTQ